LNVLDFPWFWPLLDGLYLVGSHREAGRRQNVTEIFNAFAIELALLGFSIQSVFPQAAEDFFNLFMVSGLIGRIDKNIVKIYDNANVQHVHENVVHEALKSPGSVGQAEGHNQPLEGSVLGAKGGFPFVTFPDADEVIGVPQINLGIDPRLARRI